METAFGVVSLVVIVVLTIALWVLYHKLFKVFYFGNPVKGVISELISSFFTAFILYCLVVSRFQ